MAGRRHRIADAAPLEERGGFAHRRETRGRRESGRRASHNVEFDVAVGGPHVECDALIVLCHMKCRVMMFARKQSPACKMIHERPGVSARNIDTFMCTGVVLPYHGDPVSRVLARQAERARKGARTDVFEADEAYA